MTAPAVSIIVAAHGDTAWRDIAWSRAYPSADRQTTPWDYLPVEVLCEYDRDGTLAEVRNHGAAKARGRWLVFLDADDELENGYVEAMLRHILLLPVAWHETILVAPAVRYITANRRVPQTAAIPNEGRWPDLNEAVIGTLVPRTLFLEVGGFRELSSLEDYDLWLRCVRAGAVLERAPEAVYRAHVSRQSRNADQSIYRQLREEHAEVWA